VKQNPFDLCIEEAHKNSSRMSIQLKAYAKDHDDSVLDTLVNRFKLKSKSSQRQ
jgi:uncharacterized membrane protein